MAVRFLGFLFRVWMLSFFMARGRGTWWAVGRGQAGVVPSHSPWGLVTPPRAAHAILTRQGRGGAEGRWGCKHGKASAGDSRTGSWRSAGTCMWPRADSLRAASCRARRRCTQAPPLRSAATAWSWWCGSWYSRGRLGGTRTAGPRAPRERLAGVTARLDTEGPSGMGGGRSRAGPPAPVPGH